jgi:Fur family ferric uptake transcriptional regulator
VTVACEAFFLKKLQESGFRLTPQREMMLSVLHKLEGFATAEEIYNQVQRLSSSVNISTVYRTLELLQEFRLVAGVDSTDGQRRYILLDVETPHLHLVCRQCGHIIGVALEPFEPLTSFLMEQYGFAVEAEQLCLPGLCRECRSAAAGTGRRETVAVHRHT